MDGRQAEDPGWSKREKLAGVFNRGNNNKPIVDVRFCNGHYRESRIRSKEEGYLLYDIVKILEYRFRGERGSAKSKFLLNYPELSLKVNVNDVLMLLPEGISQTSWSQIVKDSILTLAQGAALGFEQPILPDFCQSPPCKFEECMEILKQCPGVPLEPLQGCEREYKSLQGENNSLQGEYNSLQGEKKSLEELCMSLQKQMEDLKLRNVSDGLRSTSPHFGRERVNEQSRPEELDCISTDRELQKHSGEGMPSTEDSPNGALRFSVNETRNTRAGKKRKHAKGLVLKSQSQKLQNNLTQGDGDVDEVEDAAIGLHIPTDDISEAIRQKRRSSEADQDLFSRNVNIAVE